MDWTKIPTNLITKRFTDYEIASIVKFQLVWAINEEQPDRKTCLRYMTAKQYETAMTYLDSISARVNDDVSSVVKKRNAEKLRYNKNKDLNKNLHTDCTQTGNSLPEQIRLDKIREDNNEEYKESFSEFWSIYPKQRAGSKEKAYKAFCRAIKEKRATADKIISSAREYAESDEVKRGFAKGCQAWINDDRFNTIYGSNISKNEEIEAQERWEKWYKEQTAKMEEK